MSRTFGCGFIIRNVEFAFDLRLEIFYSESTRENGRDINLSARSALTWLCSREYGRISVSVAVYP